jgi:ABC-type transport system substrate-binding protein
VESIEVVDPTTVRFKLKRPIGSFVERLGAICPVPAGAAEALGKDKFKLAPVGNGPFKFSEFVADDHETIEAWSGYSLTPKPTIAKVQLSRVLESTGRTTALQTEQAEVDLNADPELFGILEGSGLKTTVTDNDAGYNGLLLNNGTAPFNDKRVRVAMAHAIDRDEIVQAVWNGNAIPQVGSLPPWYFLHSPNLTPYEFDPEKSKALLKEAGHTEPLEIELMQGIYSTGLTMAAVLQKQLEAAGFRVRIKTGDADGLYSFVFDGTWQAFSMRGNTSIVGLYPDVMTRWTLQKVFNNAPDADLEPLVKAFADADAIAPEDLDARKAAYNAIQDTIVQDARIIFLVNRKGLAAHRPTVQGISYAPDGVPDVLTQVTLA